MDRKDKILTILGVLFICLMIIVLSFILVDWAYLRNEKNENERQVAKAEEPLAVYNGSFLTSYVDVEDSFYTNKNTSNLFLPFYLDGFNGISTSDITSDVVITLKMYNPNNNLRFLCLSTSNWAGSYSYYYFDSSAVYYDNVISISLSDTFSLGSVIVYLNNTSDIFLFYIDVSFSTATDSYSFSLGSDFLFNYLSASYAANYTNGYNSGYSEGNIDGIEEGYEEGYQVGVIDGYNEGLEDGYIDGEADGYAQGYLDGYTEALDSTDYTESIDLNSYYNFKSRYYQQNPNYWVSNDSTGLIVNAGDLAINNPPSYIALYFDFSNYEEGYSYTFNASFDFIQVVNNVALLTTDSYTSDKFNIIANFDYTEYVNNVDLDGLNNAINFDFSNIEFTPQGNQNYLVLAFYNQFIYYDEWFTISDFNLIGEFTFDSRLDKAFNDGINYADSRVNDTSASYLNGLENGYKSGYSDGLNKGSDYSFGSFFFGIIDAPIRAVLSMFDFEIFGTNIRTFMLVIFSIVAVITLVRVLYKFKFGE